jgi:hypothetical protein
MLQNVIKINNATIGKDLAMPLKRMARVFHLYAIYLPIPNLVYGLGEPKMYYTAGNKGQRKRACYITRLNMQRTKSFVTLLHPSALTIKKVYFFCYFFGFRLGRAFFFKKSARD